MRVKVLGLMMLMLFKMVAVRSGPSGDSSAPANTYDIVHSGKKQYVNRGSERRCSVPEPRSSPRRLPPLACVLDALPVTLPVTRGRATAVSSASAPGNGQSATASPGPSSSSTWNCVHVHIVHCRLQSSAAYFLARRIAIRFIKEIFDAANFFTGASSSAGDLGIYHENAGGSVLKAIVARREELCRQVVRLRISCLAA